MKGGTIGKSFWIQLTATSALYFIGGFADKIQNHEELLKRPVLRAVIDNLTHVAIGLLSWAIVAPFYSKSFVIVALSCSFIDLDHFLAASSWRIDSALHAPRRGIFHCSGYALATTLVLILWNSEFALLFFVSFVSHHLRDGERRGIYLLPGLHTKPLNKNVVTIIIMTIPWIIYICNSQLLLNVKRGSSFLMSKNDCDEKETESFIV